MSKIVHITAGAIDRANRLLGQVEATALDHEVLVVAGRSAERVPSHLSCRIITRPVRVSPKQKGFFRRRFDTIRDCCWLLRLLMREDPDILHVHEYGNCLVAAIWWIIKKRTIIFDPHDIYALDGSEKGINGKLKKALGEFTAQRASAILAVSEGMKVMLSEHYPEKRIYILPNLPCTSFQNAKQSPHREASWKWNSDENVRIVYFGLIKPERLPEDVIKLISECPTVQFDVFGFSPDGAYERQLQQLVCQLGAKHIEFKGPYRPEKIESQLESYHFCILPYRIDNFNIDHCMPNKLYQSLAAGLPLIISPMAELGEIVRKFEIGYQFVSTSELKKMLSDLPTLRDKYDAMRSRVIHARSKLISVENYRSVLKRAYSSI